MVQIGRLHVLVVLGVVALALTSAALASGLSGTYSTTIKSPEQLKGRWVLSLKSGGSYTVAVNGRTAAHGQYTATATTITFHRERGSDCTGVGTYGWKRSGKTVTFTRKREAASCQGRAMVLTHQFTQVR